MAFFILILFAGAILLIGYSRKRIKVNAALANNIVDEAQVSAPAPDLHPLQLQQQKSVLLREYNKMISDHNKLFRRWELIKNKDTQPAQAVAARLAERKRAIDQFWTNTPFRLK